MEYVSALRTSQAHGIAGCLPLVLGLSKPQTRPGRGLLGRGLTEGRGLGCCSAGRARGRLALPRLERTMQ